MDSEELELFFISTWDSTVRRLKSSLDPDDRETIETFQSWESASKWLLASKSSSPLATIRPALGHLRVFAEFFCTNLASSLDASYLWGSLICLIQLISKNQKVMDQVLRMIKSLSFKAEKFNSYCQGCHVVSNAMKEVCFDIQLHFADFFTTGIKQMRAGESGGQGYQQRIQTRYEISTLELIEEISRLEPPKNNESSRFDGQKPGVNSSGQTIQRVIMMPPTKTIRFFNRIDVFGKLDDLLQNESGEYSLLSVAMHGLGGIGKSSIASSYAEKKFSEKVYDVVLWVCGEKEASLRQSMTDVALRLKLPGVQPHSHDENRVLVLEWFRTTNCNWLVIYDNVESARTLAEYWPPYSTVGRAIITTRNRSLALEPATSGLEVASWDSEKGAEFLLFLLRKSIGRDISSESSSALTLSQNLSGHALALSQMAGLIHDGEYTVQDFTTIYLENPGSAHALDAFTALWNFTFQSLDQQGASLMGVFSFLMPDHIPPEIFDINIDSELPVDLKFLKNKLTGFSAALRKLIGKALVKRDKDSGILTIHRLIQKQYRYFLEPDERQRAFNNAVKLLSNVVSKSNIEKAQLFDAWENYNKHLQHVLSLRDAFEDERKLSQTFTASDTFCEMLSDYQRFLFERNDFDECEKTCAVNLIAVGTLATEGIRINLEGTIISHQAQICEELGNMQEAIELCQREIDIRLNEVPRKEAIISFSTENLGIMYHSTNDLDRALEIFQQARVWWENRPNCQDNNWNYPATFPVNEARCLIDLNRLDQAEKKLNEASIQIKEEKPFNFGLMSYMQFCAGLLERRRCKFEVAEQCFIESQNTWLTGEQTRAHPHNAAVLYKLGACCLDQGKLEASIKHVRESLEITELYKGRLPVEHGRNLFKLSEVLTQNGEEEAIEASKLREMAELYLKKKKPNAADSGTEKAYDELISIGRR